MPPHISNPAAAAASAAAAAAAARPRQNPAPAPTMSYTPTETTIPTSLYSKVPNLALYKKLQESERKIDLLITRKSLDLQVLQSQTTQHTSYQKHSGTLRVFVYNTVENQPWQRQLLKEQGLPVPDTAVEPSWTLRVEGRYLGEDESTKIDSAEAAKPTEQKSFSSFLSGISVDLIGNEQYPAFVNSPQSSIIEWRDPHIDQQGKPIGSTASSAAFDGLDVKRNGIYNLRCKIAILPKIQSSLLRLSPPMAQFTGKQEISQQELIFLIWQYVLYKGLLKNVDSLSNVPAVTVVGINTKSSGNSNSGNSTDEGDDLKVVECDAILQSLFNVPSFRFSDLFKLIQPHFLPREPIILDYEIDTQRSTTLGDLVIDIPVELPATLSPFQQGVIESSKRIVEKLSSLDAAIQKLNNKIALGVVALQHSNSREVFYRELSQDPVKFMEKWLQSQLETFKVLKSDEGYDEEVVRRAEYYQEHEDLLKENINILLGAGKI